MAGTADALDEFAGKLQHYVDSVEQANRDIRQKVANLGEHFSGELHDKFVAEFHSEVSEPMFPLTGDLRLMHSLLAADIAYVRSLSAGGVNA